MVCESCQKNDHGKCMNTLACVCAMRGHPQIVERTLQANVYQPNPEAPQ